MKSNRFHIVDITITIQTIKKTNCVRLKKNESKRVNKKKIGFNYKHLLNNTTENSVFSTYSLYVQHIQYRVRWKCVIQCFICGDWKLKFYLYKLILCTKYKKTTKVHFIWLQYKNPMMNQKLQNKATFLSTGNKFARTEWAFSIFYKL